MPLAVPDDAACGVEGAAPVGAPAGGRAALGVLSAASPTVRTHRVI